MAKQGVFVHAQRVIRQKMNIIDAKFIGGEVGNGGHGRFIGIEALNQRYANGDFFPGSGKALQVIEDPFGRAVRPLFEHLRIDVFQVGEKQIDVR